MPPCATGSAKRPELRTIAGAAQHNAAKRSMIARRRWFRCRALKSPGIRWVDATRAKVHSSGSICMAGVVAAKAGPPVKVATSARPPRGPARDRGSGDRGARACGRQAGLSRASDTLQASLPASDDQQDSPATLHQLFRVPSLRARIEPWNPTMFHSRSSLACMSWHRVCSGSIDIRMIRFGRIKSRQEEDRRETPARLPARDDAN